MRCPTISELPLPPFGRTGWPWTAEGEQLPPTRSDGAPWPGISIVTPSFNQAQYLEATIRSILLQGYPNLEYIIMDGGSTDGSLDIIRKYEPWLALWKSEPDGGQYSAVQKGFEHSSGEIMAWLNSDDLYFPWTLHVAAEILSTFLDLRWISTSSLSVLGSNNNLFDITSVDPYNRRDFFSQDFIRRPLVIQQEATFWRRALWNQSGAHLADDLHYAGDFELWTRFWQYEDLAMTPTPLAMFRFHEQQKTSNINGYIKEVLMVLRKLRRPLPIPGIFLFPLTFLLKRHNPAKNWFGTRIRIVYLDNQKGRWLKVEFYSFRRAVKSMLQSLVDIFRRINGSDIQHVWSNYTPDKED